MNLVLHHHETRPAAAPAPRPSLRAQGGRVEDALVHALAHLETGIVLLDRQARVLFATAPARRILDARRLVCAADGKLRAGSPKATADLRHAVAGGPRRRSVLIAAEGDDDPLLARLVPLARASDPDGCGPVAALFLPELRDASPSLADLQLRFGLTPAEACCAREMLRGEGIGAYARRAGISHATARTHLKHVFEKTGARRQAQLVSRLLAETPARAAADDDAPPGAENDGSGAR
ncbi:helix-turn-helix transcriptional regulator [Salinarimonas sp.]|uniref:helix-turn-helix transcriptional regulator n=1 Tax=Salinarimonas sp. TaxID=2766526 RepID=UPI0032D8C263